LDKYEKIDFISLTKADQEGLLDEIPAHTRYLSFRLIFPNGDAKSGSEALLELIAILPGGKIISPIINYFPGRMRFIYKRFSRLHDRGLGFNLECQFAYKSMVLVICTCRP
jgi:predicted DCC family thiol-disulfide oxidoreductase YuxK